MSQFKWVFSPFSELSPEQVYQILKVRQEVFIIEQEIYYVDTDDRDQDAWHLFAWDEDKREVYAYLRLLPPGKMATHSVGRVLTSRSHRGQGLGKQLMAEFMQQVQERWGAIPLSMSAQSHLEEFYRPFGFETVSEPYWEEGILHIRMIFKPCAP
ncbi:GNAT family N-acetyltransferase [Pseudobacteriovorax antillogorgiicola]|uniref:ElaA protein n=1 Tax=Pseudobacteriovorax antillogorgiicola TaxID=1513793 RepID=A0A1Y6BFB2_9BACT|nr:GNAT family N-acetyltransferase [Pseudobacteriovorax antillogorgiicola]TCS56361.1 ElaA protein [Pseudobacteriovorax antillogorgiicola]SMF06679.1 ElaA protein [Pseudobacteriovorax antillogorgiicola]